MTNNKRHLSIFMPDLVVGGAERSMLKLAGGIADRGYSVDLVLRKAEGPFLAEAPDSIRIVDLHCSRTILSLCPLVHYLKREQPQALMALLHANMIAIWAKFISRVPVRLVVSERNTLSSEANHYKTDLRMRMMPRLVKIFYPLADCIVAVSKGVADDLIQNYGIPNSKVQVIYNPIITPEFRAKAKSELDHPWFKPGEPPVILAVGRLTCQKDFATLIRAYCELRKNIWARLLIIGEGDERPELEALIDRLDLDHDISLPGFVANPYPYMVQAAVFVLSSRWEGLPGVLIEAMYCQTPIVATDCPSGPREILDHGHFGTLVPSDDPYSLARSIEDALKGRIRRPPPESWLSFEQETVVDQYIKVLFNE